AVTLDIDEHALHGHPGALRHGIDDAQIRLVRHQEVHLRCLHPDLGESVLGGGDHALNRAPEDFLPFELPASVTVDHSVVGVAPAHAAHTQRFTGFAAA